VIDRRIACLPSGSQRGLDNRFIRGVAFQQFAPRNVDLLL